MSSCHNVVYVLAQYGVLPQCVACVGTMCCMCWHSVLHVLAQCGTVLPQCGACVGTMHVLPQCGAVLLQCSACVFISFTSCAGT